MMTIHETAQFLLANDRYVLEPADQIRKLALDLFIDSSDSIGCHKSLLLI